MNKQLTVQSAFSAAATEILHSNMDSPRGIATLVLFALCFLDVFTTTFILSQGGYEMNPVMMAIVPIPVLHMLLKWGLVAFITASAGIAEHIVPKSGMLLLCIIIGWYLLVVSHNVIILTDFSLHIS